MPTSNDVLALLRATPAKNGAGTDATGAEAEATRANPRANEEQEVPPLVSHLQPLNLRELLAGPIPETRWRWNGWLAHEDVGLLVADPGVGKSLLSLGLANAVRLGGEFLGEGCEQGRVGVFDLENPLSEVHKRLCRVGLTDVDHEGIDYFHAPALNLASPTGPSDLVAAAERYALDLIILDSFRRLAPGIEENSSRDIAEFFAPLRALASSGRTVLVIHHARKRYDGQASDAGQMVRGSGDFLASVDTLLYMRAKESGVFTLEHGKSRRGLPHDPIQVRVSHADDDRLEFVNEGEIAAADDKVEAMLAKILRTLHEDGGPIKRQVLALRVGSGEKDGTFSRALKLGWQRDQLAKTREGSGPTLYALAIEEDA